MMDEKFMVPELVSFDLLTKWKAFRKYIENEKNKSIPFLSFAELIKKKKLVTLSTTR